MPGVPDAASCTNRSPLAGSNPGHQGVRVGSKAEDGRTDGGNFVWVAPIWITGSIAICRWYVFVTRNLNGK